MGWRDDVRQGWRQGKREAAIQRCWKLVREERSDDLLAFSEGAAARFPESAEIQLMFATGLRHCDRPNQEVVGQAIRAAALGARDPNMQVRAGNILIDAGDVESARECVARAEEVADENFTLAVDLDGLKGRIAARDGDFEEAEELFRSVVRREPRWSGNWTQLARFLWAKGRNEDALVVLAEALVRLKEDGEPQPRRGDVESVERLQGEIAGKTRMELDG